MFTMTGTHTPHRLLETDAGPGARRPHHHVGALVTGVVLTLIGVVGALRTFDPVALSVAQVLFLVTTVVGVALAMRARP
jgi:hypothetical protein